MNLLDLLAKFKDLVAAIKSGNMVAILDITGDLLKLAAVLGGGFGGDGHASDAAVIAGFDEALVDLQSVTSFGADGVESATDAIDPATIMTIISLAKMVIEFIKKRRQG